MKYSILIRKIPLNPTLLKGDQGGLPLYNDFKRRCQTKKDFIAMPVLRSRSPSRLRQSRLDYNGKTYHSSGIGALRRRVNPLLYAPWSLVFKGGCQIESVFNPPSTISCKVVLIKLNRSPSRSFGEWIGRRRHLSFVKPLFSMNFWNIFSTSGGSTFLK